MMDPRPASEQEWLYSFDMCPGYSLSRQVLRFFQLAHEQHHHELEEQRNPLVALLLSMETRTL